MSTTHDQPPAGMILVPRPSVAFGTSAISAELADATYLRRAALDLRENRQIADAHLLAAVVKLVMDAADATERASTLTSAHTFSITRDVLDPQDTVLVIDPDQRSWRIHREEADPEHKLTPYRLAAGWFANLPAAHTSAD